jgi:hypothetical protein
MLDLGRRYWIAKETGSPRQLVAFAVFALVCLGLGKLAHLGFLVGLGFAVAFFTAIALPTYLRRKR